MNVFRDNSKDSNIVDTESCGERLKGQTKKEIRKRKVQAGVEHISSKGNVIPKKVFEDSPCNCSLNCNRLVPFERRKKIFSDYYTFNWELKSAFIMNHVTVVAKKRSYTKRPVSRRNYTRVYKLPAFDDAEDIVVCKTFFKQTLCISDGKIDLTLKQKERCGGPVEDKRGRHEPHNKTRTDDVQFVCDFINEFPSYNSHYNRKSYGNIKCLPPGFSLSELYRLYQERCEDGRKVVCFSTFREIINKEFYLSFDISKRYICDNCEAFKKELEDFVCIDVKPQVQEDKKLHHQIAENARERTN